MEQASTEALLERAEVLMDVGRYDEALGLIGTAAAKEPGNGRVHSLAALALLRAGRPAEAVRAAEHAAGLEPSSDWPHRLRALALAAQARRCPAPEAQRLGQMAVVSARQAVRLAPGNARSYCAAAEAEVAAGNLLLADAAARRAIELAPNLADGWVAASQVALKAKNWSAAEAACRRALSIEPASYAAQNNLGAALRGAGRWRDAAKMFASAARLRPNEEVARRNLAGTGQLVLRLVVLILLLPLIALPGGWLLVMAFAVSSNVYISRHPNRVARFEAWGTRVGLRLARTGPSRPVLPGALIVLALAVTTAGLAQAMGLGAAMTVAGLIFVPILLAGVIHRRRRRRQQEQVIEPPATMLPTVAAHQVRTGIVAGAAVLAWLITAAAAASMVHPGVGYSRAAALGPLALFGGLWLGLSWVIVHRRRTARNPRRPK